MSCCQHQALEAQDVIDAEKFHYEVTISGHGSKDADGLGKLRFPENQIRIAASFRSNCRSLRSSKHSEAKTITRRDISKAPLRDYQGTANYPTFDNTEHEGMPTKQP